MGNKQDANGDTGFLKISDKAAITPEGGFAVYMLNNSGVQIDKGMCVRASTTVNEAVEACPIDDEFPVGIAYANIPNGSSGWIVIGGRAEVLVEAAAVPAAGYWLGVSNGTAGRARTQAGSPGSTVLHFREIGHALGAKDVNNLVYAFIHFN